MKGVADAYPLTPSQVGILFDALRDPDPELYFEQVRFDLVGDIDPARLRRAWEETIDHHPALRTIWLWEGLDDPVQVVRESVELPWTELDWRTEADPRPALDALAHDDRRLGFDLARPPVMRITAIRLADDRVHVVWSFHHIMLDGWSTALVVDEVLERCAGRGVATSRAFRDHVAWIGSQDVGAAERHWRAVLDGFDQPTRLAGDPGASESQFRLSRSFRSLDEATTARLAAVARRHRVTLNTLVQTAWATVLSCHSGDDDVMFGVTSSGRPAEIDGVEAMVGMFLSTLPMRVRFDGDRTVVELWDDVQRQQLDLTQYQYSSLADVARWSDVPPGVALFDTALVFENFPRPEPGDRSFRLERHSVFEQTRFPLTVMIGPGDRLEALALHDQSRFGPELVDDLLDGLFRVLARAADAPGEALREISVISESERIRLLIEINRTDRPVPDSTVHAEVRRRAAERPEALAVIDGDDRWTYRELADAAAQLSGTIRSRGVGRADAVIVAVPRSAQMVIAMLATIQSGAAYVPLDPMTATDRRSAIVDDAAPALIVTTSDHCAGFVETGVPIIDIGARRVGDESTDPSQAHATGDDPMFVVFTSGSTGRPKGVPGTHRAVLNRCCWQTETAPYADDEVACQKTTAEFVDHVAELWAPLVAGRPVVIVGDDEVREPESLVSILARHRVARIVLVPSLLATLLDTVDDLAGRLPDLRIWTLSGERLSRELADRFRAAMPHAALVNVYGMSEVMADATSFDGDDAGAADSVPIGRPISNQRVYLLDRVGRPTPIGVPGQIWISGEGVASGYWGRDDLTAERFLPNPFGEGVHARRYATGDLARWTHDLELEYLGRIDRQVKVRGVRVELGDAEAAVARIPGIREAAVVGVPSSHDTTRLVAHVVTDEGVDLGEARRTLAERVPDYLVPSELHRIAALPLLPSGKIDRGALATTEIHRPTIDTSEIDDELAAMIDIWRDVVATDEIGPDDDFFDVGGHSLAGMRLLARLHRNRGVNLELSVLYSDSTPRTLLDRVRTIAAGDTTDDAGRGVRHLVRITTADDPRRTLYCVHGAGGNVLNFRDLARALSPGWGVVGVQARGVDGITPPHESLDELCDAYITELLADRPDGPQFLAGFSGGGIIAYEIAVRLAARGRPLTALILFDTFHRSIQARRRTPGEHLAALFRQGPAYLLERRRVRRQRRLYANAQDVVEANTAHDGPVPHELRDAHVVASIRSMLDDYETPDYDGAVWLYAATDVRDVLRHAGPDRGWSRSASDLFTESVPGDHDDLILEPNASQLAARLGERLDRAFADTDTNQVGS